MPQGSELSRWLLAAGISLIVLAGLVWLLGRLGISLPGDFHFQRGSFSCFVPLGSSLLISLLLTLLLNLILRSLGK